MSPLQSDLQLRLDQLRADILAQGRRVQAMVEASFDAVFTRDAAAAQRATAMDEEIDRVDVAIEQAAVAILADACKAGASLESAQVRSILTIVKVNNELERIADEGVAICEEVAAFRACGPMVEPPRTFRVLANSVIGILRDCVGAMEKRDGKLAKVVLMSETAVEEFKKALVRDVQQQVAARTLPLDVASALHDTAMLCVNIADHCTNIAEQVLYVATGTIVRHMDGRWEEIKLPG